MTREDKELLLKDLCARLPYGLKYNFGGNDGCYYTMDRISLIAVDDAFPIEDCKPYLLPLSSMTDEQKKEEYEICKEFIIGYESNLIDFYNKYHLDQKTWQLMQLD